MGCDIHLHTEVKIEGKWRHWGNPSIDRWYVLFEKMAGVRGEIENAIVSLKGLPEDATFETLFDYNRFPEEWHSESWLGYEEIQEVYKWWNLQASMRSREMDIIEDQFGYCMGNGWDDTRDSVIEDVRWVFWFDN